MKVFVFNEIDKYMYVGGVIILSGEICEVEEIYFFGYQGEEVQVVFEDDFFVELLKLIVLKIKEQLLILNDQDLDCFGQLEQDKGVDVCKSLFEVLFEVQFDCAVLNFDIEVNVVFELLVEELLLFVFSYSIEILQCVFIVEQVKGQSVNVELVKAIEDEFVKEDCKV